MPLPKKPVGGAGPREPAPPLAPEIELPEPIEDFALPSLDDLDFSPLPPVTEAPVATPQNTIPSYREPVYGAEEPIFSVPIVQPQPESAPAVSRVVNDAPSSPVGIPTSPAPTTVSDESSYPDDEDEETKLNRLLGLDDDDAEPFIEPQNSEQSSDDELDEENIVSGLPTENLVSRGHSSQISEAEFVFPEDDDSDDENNGELDFDSLLLQMEEENNSLSSDSTNVSPIDNEVTNSPQTSGRYSQQSEDSTDSESDSGDDGTGWDAILSEMEKEIGGSSVEPNLTDYENPSHIELDAEEDHDEADSSALDDDDDEDDEDWTPPEDDFVPPANPFAIPKEFADPIDSTDSMEEESALPVLDDEDDADWDSDEEESDEIENDEEDEDDEDKPSLGQKLSGLLSVAAIKDSIGDYFAKIKAELHDEDPPSPRSSRKKPEDEEGISEDDEEDTSEESDEKDQQGKSKKGSRNPFGFLSPIKTLYMGLVNLIFGIISAILGILSKLPLIGFIFSAALGATQILKGIAQYLPLVFVIGGLAAVSYFSIPRDSQMIMPDNGGATFTEFVYNSDSHTVSGLVTNTGDIIAEVQPEFKVMTIQPELNPLTWFMPSETAVCVSDTVWVDIDDATLITVACSGDVTGFIPRVTGELK